MRFAISTSQQTPYQYSSTAARRSPRRCRSKPLSATARVPWLGRPVRTCLYPSKIRRPSSRQRGDDLAELVLGERAQSLGANVAQRAGDERELGHDLVVRRLRDDDRVVATLHEVERLQLAPERLQELLGPLEPAGALLDRLEALLRVLQ